MIRISRPRLLVCLSATAAVICVSFAIFPNKPLVGHFPRQQITSKHLTVEIVDTQAPPFTVYTDAPLYHRTHNTSLPVLGDSLDVHREMQDSARYIKVEGIAVQNVPCELEIRCGEHITVVPLEPSDVTSLFQAG